MATEVENNLSSKDREPQTITVREHDLIYIDRTRFRLKTHPDSNETTEIIRVTSVPTSNNKK